MQHVVMMGQPRSNKSALLMHLQGVHKRKLVNMNELVEWNRDNQTEAWLMMEQYQASKQNEIKVVEAEREKLLKKAGKKSKELEDKWGAIPLHLYQYVSEELLKKLIQCRMAHPDCNAGVMFDNLVCEYWPSEMYLFKCLLEVVGMDHLQLVVMREQLDQYGLETCKVIEWEGMEDLALKDEPTEVADVETSPKVKKGGKKKDDKKDAKKLQGTTKKTTDRGKSSKSGGRTSVKAETNIFSELEYFIISPPGTYIDELERTKMEDTLQKV